MPSLSLRRTATRRRTSPRPSPRPTRRQRRARPRPRPDSALRALLASAALLASVAAASAAETLRVAVASTVDHSGLAALLADGYSKACGCEVRVIAAGSTRALAILAAGDAPVAITHAPEIERKFVEGAPGRSRTEFMANEFVLAGPAGDPARARGKDLSGAFVAIASAGAPFVSRGDGSGTNLAEERLWREAAGGVPLEEKWYRRAGVQMAAALQVADQTGAYTLSDSGTLAALSESGALGSELIARNEPPLRNVYSVVVSDTAGESARGFASWLRTEEAAGLIGSARAGGMPMFRALR